MKFEITLGFQFRKDPIRVHVVDEDGSITEVELEADTEVIQHPVGFVPNEVDEEGEEDRAG